MLVYLKQSIQSKKALIFRTMCLKTCVNSFKSAITYYKTKDTNHYICLYENLCILNKQTHPFSISNLLIICKEVFILECLSVFEQNLYKLVVYYPKTFSIIFWYGKLNYVLHFKCILLHTDAYSFCFNI